jgi:uncharacterized protein
MLPPDLLCFRDAADGFKVPAWLADRDDVWLRKLLHALDAKIGHPVADLESDLRRELEPIARLHRVHPRALRGAIRVATRACSRDRTTSVDPEALRAALFQAACTARTDGKRLDHPARAELLQKVGASFALAPVDIPRLLFADMPGERTLAEPDVPLTPELLRDRYHLGLLAGSLLRASEVRVWVREHVRSVARFAKLTGLLCTFEIVHDGTKLTLSGPLALFHATLKYGRALARFIPTVLSTPGFRVEADCTLGDERLRVAIDASAPLPRTHALPRESDSRLETLLSRDLRRGASGFSLEREAAAFHVGSSLFFPDFVLRRGTERVFVEVVGFWTPEYLASKLVALESLREVPLVVAIDSTHGVLPERLPHAEVVPFSKRIDAGAIVAAAERSIMRHAR